jgi:hypothetical protein
VKRRKGRWLDLCTREAEKKEPRRVKPVDVVKSMKKAAQRGRQRR